MDFSYSPRTQELQARLQAFMAEHVTPDEGRYFAEIEANAQVAYFHTLARTLRFADGADGADEVHRNSLAKIELGKTRATA